MQWVESQVKDELENTEWKSSFLFCFDFLNFKE
jgi:hypothetical protein